MPRRLFVALALLAASRAGAQKVFTAATTQTILGFTEESQGTVPAHVLMARNESSVPVIIFGVSITACENIRQSCGGRTANFQIPPGGRRSVGRVEAKRADEGFSYRWSFSYRPDSSDERMMAALREEAASLAGAPGATIPDSQVTSAMAPVPPERTADDAPVVAPAPPPPSDDPLPPLVASTDVDGIARASSAIAPTRQFLVINKSRYPIVVYSFNLATCLNVKQVCGRTPVNVRVPAGGRMQVGRVDAQDPKRRYSYDWNYDWRLDTADVKVASALRVRGVREGSLGSARNLAIQPEAKPARLMTTTVRERFRFKVARESILGSTQVKGAVVSPVGACIDPSELAALERDTTIAASPAVKPRLTDRSLTLPMLPAELRADGTGPVRVIARWVVDVDGGTIPGSTRIVESPHGLVSVQACGAVIGARLEPARDAADQPVRTWVEVPLVIQR